MVLLRAVIVVVQGGVEGGGRGEEVDPEAGAAAAVAPAVVAVVLIEHVVNVLVAGDGDKGVEILRGQLVLDGHLRVEHALYLLPQLCPPTGRDIIQEKTIGGLAGAGDWSGGFGYLRRWRSGGRRRRGSLLRRT